MTDREKIKRLVEFIRHYPMSFNYFELSWDKKAGWYDIGFQKSKELMKDEELELWKYIGED